MLLSHLQPYQADYVAGQDVDLWVALTYGAWLVPYDEYVALSLRHICQEYAQHRLASRNQYKVLKFYSYQIIQVAQLNITLQSFICHVL